MSIGTLYQYFSNKEALVAALIEEHVQDVLTLVETALAKHASEPLPAVLRALIKASLDAHRLNPELHKVLIEQVPREGALAAAMGISERLTEMLRTHLRERCPGLPPSRIRLVAFVAESTVEALTHRAIIEGPRWLTTGALEAEAMDLLLPYLTHSLSA
ncbi:TetR family transcriptional regulator [Caldimonas brevitalea]|uniref:TetR family transcriptional regulator n=1 Tax=Caldimonas brevitalea TaxID=413882 RepID=UPI001EED1F9E